MRKDESIEARAGGRQKLKFRIRPEISRLAVAGIFASLLATAMIYSRDGSGATEGAQYSSKQMFIQPKDWVQAEARFTPTSKMRDTSRDQALEIANAFPLPRPRPVTPGYYYEQVRAQGDGEEGEYALVERRCIPKIDMPRPCYLPERGRQKFPVRRD
jgi:hypothetical protein